jgi:hypothetical protein
MRKHKIEIPTYHEFGTLSHSNSLIRYKSLMKLLILLVAMVMEQLYHVSFRLPPQHVVSIF